VAESSLLGFAVIVVVGLPAIPSAAEGPPALPVVPGAIVVVLGAVVVLMPEKRAALLVPELADPPLAPEDCAEAGPANKISAKGTANAFKL
jgi:hypothetical protein